MGKGDRSSSATRNPKEQDLQPVSNIPVMFRLSQGEGHAAKAPAPPSQHVIALGGSCPLTDTGHSPTQPEQNLSLSKFQMIAMDIKFTLSAVITDRWMPSGKYKNPLQCISHTSQRCTDTWIIALEESQKQSIKIQQSKLLQLYLITCWTDLQTPLQNLKEFTEPLDQEDGTKIPQRYHMLLG